MAISDAEEKDITDTLRQIYRHPQWVGITSFPAPRSGYTSIEARVGRVSQANFKDLYQLTSRIKHYFSISAHGLYVVLTFSEHQLDPDL